MTQQFEFEELAIAGLFSIQRKSVHDHRGFFSRFYCAREFRDIGISGPVAQMNHARTSIKGSIRGMHFQYPPHSETKIVTCLRGEVFDVAVDLREGSPTFMQWQSVILSEERQNSICIPEGFAHGFQTLTDDCELFYIHTNYYEPRAEGGLRATDPCLAIDWPLEIAELSDRDRNHALIDADFKGVRL